MAIKTVTTKKAPKAPKADNALEAVVLTAEGKKSGSISLPESVFGVAWNADLVHQVVTAIKANARNTVAHTKDRGEVRGGGRKPWKQKGTGRARHGSTRSPIWVGGGVAHGPRSEKVFSLKANRKMRAKALFSVLSRKLHGGEIAFVDALSFTKPKTSEAKKILSALGSVKELNGLDTRRNAALIALPARDAAVEKSFRNFGNIAVEEVRNLNPMNVLTYRRLVIVGPQESVKILEKRAEA